MIKNFFNKLSIQISAIIIICGTLGVATFCYFMPVKKVSLNLPKLRVISENTEAYANNIENQIIDQNVSITDVDTLDKILGTSDIYSVNLYNKADNLAITGSFATMLDNFYHRFNSI